MPETKLAKRTLPAITLEQAELHGTVDVLARTAGHGKVSTDATYADVQKADLGMRVARNAQPYVSEGAASLQERFTRLLNSIG